MKGQISFLVDRLHVALSDRAVLRHFYDRLKINPSNMTLDKREMRKECYRYALECHHDNQAIVRDFRF